MQKPRQHGILNIGDSLREFEYRWIEIIRRVSASEYQLDIGERVQRSETIYRIRDIGDSEEWSKMGSE